MSGLDDIRAERLKKLSALQDAGVDPYPAESGRTHEIDSVLEQFSDLESSKEQITIAGRVMSVRGQGGIMFVDLYDGTAKMQALIKKDDVHDFDLFLQTVDASDFVAVTGTALTSKRGEKSVAAAKWQMLAKSLRPVPSEWYGIKDEDERLRQRYLDMLLSTDTAALVKKRSLFWNAVRAFMLERDYIEVETPILETKTGGAEARPFITHHNALDVDVYLRISHELWHKKLIIAGFPKVFEIGRVFRNEGMSHEHAQDYTHFEFYEAFQDARKGVPMLIDLYRTVAQKAFGTLEFTINGFVVDLGKEWERYDYNDMMMKQYGFDPREVDIATVRAKLDTEGIAYEKNADLGRLVDLLWKKVRKSIGGPAILTGIPVYLEPLAKKSKGDGRVVDRFQILLGGSEVGKAFNELNDPIDQLARFETQQALRDAGDEEAQMADYEYVEAMEYGMPPTFGFGVSERLFAFLAGVSIREGQLFPLMRPRTEM